MSDKEQTFASHRKYVPGFHFVLFGIVVVVLVWSLWRLITHFGEGSIYHLLTAVSLALLFYYCRVFPLRLQDRVIRLEERLRLHQLLPEELRSRIQELTPGQLIGLRFAGDAEVTELVRRVLEGELKGREEIKRQIEDWRADQLRA